MVSTEPDGPYLLQDGNRVAVGLLSELTWGLPCQFLERAVESGFRIEAGVFGDRQHVGIGRQQCLASRFDPPVIDVIEKVHADMGVKCLADAVLGHASRGRKVFEG